MKILNMLLLIFLFISCSNKNIEKYEFRIDNDIQVYDYTNKFIGDYFLEFEIQYAFLDSNYSVHNKDDYFIYINAGFINDGKLTINYNDIDYKYCKDFAEDHLKTKLAFSNNEVNIKIIYPFNINVINYDNDIIGFLRFEDYNCEFRKCRIYHSGPCSGIYFIYATGQTKISGEYNDKIYDLDLKKGWNIVYYYEDIKSLKEMQTTYKNDYPNRARWTIIK
jgi:hypothetical protein